MTRWFVFWAVLLLALAGAGHATGTLWLTLLPLLLPLIYADQYVAAHYSEEEQP